MVTNVAQEHCHRRSVIMLMLAVSFSHKFAWYKMIQSLRSTVAVICCHFTRILFKIAARDAIVTLKLCTQNYSIV